MSDVLPYELPPSFSNRGLYDLVRGTSLHCGIGSAFANVRDVDDALLLAVLLGREVQRDPSGAVAVGSLRWQDLGATRPFQFVLRHKVNDRRALTVPHPRSQVEVADFYGKYAELILFYTSRSPFSLRRPMRVAPIYIVKDWLFSQSSQTAGTVEDDRFEIEWLRSYFTYAKYSNVYKFYDSAEYRSCERRFGYLAKVDVAKCFDSVYTHSIAWATHGLEMVKQNLGSLTGSFGDDFDYLMQRMNYAETSGITIGSEASRIFAEIILQDVDLSIESELHALGLSFGEDYEILRYVDDYFIFLADPAKKIVVVDCIARHLRRYKLHLNAAKEEGEHTPWLSPLTVAKRRVKSFTSSALKVGDPTESMPGRPYLDVAQMVSGYKSVLIDTGASHFDLANYSLSRAEKLFEKLVGVAMDVESLEVAKDLKSAHLSAVVDAMLRLLDYSFFVFSGASRMSPAVKLARICSGLVRFTSRPGVPLHHRERALAIVRDELLQQMRRAAGSEPDAVSALLLDCISDLGAAYMVEEDVLIKLFGFRGAAASLAAPGSMNMLLWASLLLHMKAAPNYLVLRRACNRWVESVMRRQPSDAERALVAMNILTCPFADVGLRSDIVALYGGTPASARRLQSRTVNVDWEGFDLYRALQRKHLREVY